MKRENQRLLAERVRDTDIVLDVGGWHAPLNRANFVLDFMPYETRNQAGAFLTDKWPEERFTKNSFIQADICKTPWPFRDKQFDFVLCSHTLEDVRDPIAVCSEIVRVGKAGYIEVPSRLVESTRGVERPFYVGYYHHRWLCEVSDQSIQFLFKPAMLHAYRQFFFPKRWFQKVSPQYDSSSFFWEGSFDFQERILIDRDAVQEDLRQFKRSFKDVPDIFVRKYDWLGRKIHA